MKILKLPEVKRCVALSRSSIYAAIACGRFPKQISLGPRAVGWLDSEINSWVQERIAVSRQEGAQ